MILLPDGSSSVADWTPAPFPNTIAGALDDDNGDTSYVKSDTNNAAMTIEYANPSVAEADIDTITSVRFLSSGRSTHRTYSSRVLIAFAVPSGNASEGVRYDPHASSHETINGTARPYSDGLGGTNWTYSDLENLEMRCTKNGTQQLRLSYLAIRVTYTEAVAAVTDNATFFGSNF